MLEIEFALSRIENGTYGICEMTEEKIENDRLLAIPWTRLSIEGAATHRRDQQRVAACLCEREQGLKEQQAAQCKGAAGAVHGNRLTSEGRVDPSRDPISAHYEISRANLTKSLLVFLLRGKYIAHFAGDY